MFLSQRAARTLLLACLAAPLPAAPPLTTIQDVLFKADGTRFNGFAVIEWRGFDAADTSNIAPNSITVQIPDGMLRVKLVPTTNASPKAYYTVRYNSAGKVQFTETWSVPPASGVLPVRSVRISAPPGAVTPPASVQIADITGLSDELAIRVSKGVGYSPSRAAVISPSGALEAASGTPTDCVRVDGTSGPCGSGGGGATEYADGEVPTGPVDGANRAFLLQSAPNPSSSLLLFRNGLLQKSGFDYTLSGQNITFLPGAAPQTGDILLAGYRLGLAAELGIISTAPQVLCGSTGAATTLAAPTSLAVCVIPAGLLQPGDRIDIRYDFTHEGAATGFVAELRWGGSVLLSRAAGASAALVTGRAEAGVGESGVYWSGQSWGASLPLEAAAGTAVDPLSEPILIDLIGSMDSQSGETVTLRAFSVLRYPRHP